MGHQASSRRVCCALPAGENLVGGRRDEAAAAPQRDEAVHLVREPLALVDGDALCVARLGAEYYEVQIP